MGVVGLHQDIIRRAKLDQDNGTNKHSFAMLVPPGRERAVVGVDVSIWLHQALNTQSAADSHHTVPNVPNEPILSAIKEKCCILRLNSIDPLLCFDGFNNPIKMETHNTRVSAAKKAEAVLERLLADGRPQSFVEAKCL